MNIELFFVLESLELISFWKTRFVEKMHHQLHLGEVPLRFFVLKSDKNNQVKQAIPPDKTNTLALPQQTLKVSTWKVIYWESMFDSGGILPWDVFFFSGRFHGYGFVFLKPVF